MDDADRAEEAAVSTPGDGERDGASSAPSAAPRAAAEGGRDRPPRKRPGRPKGSKSKPKGAPGEAAPADEQAKQEKRELRALKKKIAGVLTGPAMVLEPWPAQHVENAAPDLAGAIIKLAEDDPALRRRMLKFFEGGAVGNLVFAGAVYLAPVLIYYGAPAPALVKRAFDVPDRRLLLAQAEREAGGGPPPMPQPATPEAMEQEATARGFANVEDYIAAANQTGSWDIRALRAYGPPPSEPPAPDS